MSRCTPTLSTRKCLKGSLASSTITKLNELRYELHLAKVRLINRIHPGAVLKRQQMMAMQDVKLHWGCGRRALEGWLNIDGWKSEATNYVHDLRKKLPLRAGSVEIIFTEHVFEHIEYDIGKRILSDFCRLMKPGGRIRIVVPDLTKCCEAYQRKDREWFSKVQSDCETSAEGFNRIFYGHFHRQIYDYEMLANALRHAGFSSVSQCSHLSSTDPRLLIDTDSESRSLVSLYVEAVR